MNWKNKDAIKIHNYLIPIFGNPIGIINVEGGLSIWTEKNMKKKKVFGLKNIFVEHLIRDEAITHLCPKKHNDFFYSYVRVDITPKNAKDIIMLSGSVGYDPLKKLLSARCAGLAPNIATLKVATDIIIGKKVEVNLDDNLSQRTRSLQMSYLKKYNYKTLTDVQNKGIYGKTIKKCIEDKLFLKETYKQLVKNVKIIGTGDKKYEGYWRGAFDVKNNKCLPPK